MLVTIFGGGGFVGRYVVQELLNMGLRVRVAERDPGTALRLKPLAALGQIQLVRADVQDLASVERVVAGAGAVVNLAAVFGSSMDAINHQGSENVAKSAARAGVATFVHMSALGADASGDSAYGRSKGQGEDAVRRACPTAVIVRPSVIFGREDRFTNKIAEMARGCVLPVLAPNTRFQPVYVVDVARAIAAIVADSAGCAGKTFELGGPQVMTMMEINRFVADYAGHTPRIVAMPNWLGAIAACVPGVPINRDQLKMLKHDTVVSEGSMGLSDLDVESTPMGAVADGWLLMYRKHGRFSTRAKV